MSQSSQSLDYTEQTTAAVLDVGNSSMFAIFADDKWMDAFNNSRFKFFLLPLIAIGFLINAVVSSIRYYYAANKNLTKTYGLITQILGAVGANVSIFGSVISELVFNKLFVIGPYFFLAAVSLGLVFNLTQIIAKSVALSSAPRFSIERVRLARELNYHLFLSLMLGSIVVSVCSVILLPGVYPTLAVVSSLVSSSLCLLNFAWSVSPLSFKDRITKFFGLNYPIEDMKPDLKEQITYRTKKELRSEQAKAVRECKVGFFHRAFRKKAIALILEEQKFDEAQRYLVTELNSKHKQIDKVLCSWPNSKKHLHKKEVLQALKNSLSTGQLLTATDLEVLYQKNYLSKQSFFSEVGDLEDLVQAYLFYGHENEKAGREISLQKSASSLQR